jgi:hypothetical protein
MKIQNPGKELGPARIPQKAYNMIDNNVASAPAISSFGDPAMSMCARELAKRNTVMIMRTVWKPRM